jgi:hypothetical protein
MRVLLAILVFLAIAEAGCRTPTKDPNDTQRVERRMWDEWPDFATKYEGATFR